MHVEIVVIFSAFSAVKVFDIRDDPAREAP
jgi:hypothetical protein